MKSVNSRGKRSATAPASRGSADSQATRAAFVAGRAARGDCREALEIEGRLSEADPRLGALIKRVLEAQGARRFSPSTARSHFDALARSIIDQQLSQLASASIYARYTAVLGGEAGPDRLLATPDARVREAGVSKPKLRYLRALAEAMTSGRLELERVGELPDAEIIARLTEVPGVGVWTAQMFLMFRLGRLDVLPTRDLGIQKGVQLAHGLRHPAAPGYVERAGKRWAPFRSIACLYLWAGMNPS